jgi:hypothetical protein
MTPQTAEETPEWPGLFQLGEMARESVLEALGSMPELFFGAIFLLIVLTVLDGFVQSRWTPDGSAWVRDALQRSPHLLSAVLSLFFAFGRTVVSACVAVAIHRFILLQQRASGLGPLAHRYTWMFVFWVVGLDLFYLFAMLPIPVLPRLLLAVFLFVVGMRLSLIFPAVAIDAQSSSLTDRVRTSWNRTRGKVILLFLAYVVAVFPFVIVFIVVGFVLTFASFIWSDTHPLLGAELIDLLVKPFAVVAGAACAAAVASCAYSAALSVERREVRQP